MKKIVTLKLTPSEAANSELVKEQLASALSVTNDAVTGFSISKHSIDARSKQVWINLSIEATVNEPFYKAEASKLKFEDVARANSQVLIIGAGPAGLFAALKLIEHGIKPIVLERGKDVRARRRDLAILNKEGIINPESNYCFGEGGAGTYSDGKLYTRSDKRGNLERILRLFVQFGADERILYESHPHIGTNKLPHIIASMSKQILECGESFYLKERWWI